MTEQTPAQNQTETTETNPVDKMSFVDYQKFRRGEKVESKSAPEDAKSHEQKKPADSEPAEKEEIGEEADEESEKSDDSEDSENDKPKKKGGFKRRIDKLSAQKAKALEELEYWKSEALKSKGQGEQKQAPKVEAKSVSDGGPNADDFDTHAEFVRAVTKWEIQQDRKAAQAEEQKKALMSEHQKLYESHAERVKSFADKNDDFEDLLESVADVTYSPTVEQVIVTSENGPELMYELAKNRAEFERIAKLPPLAAAQALGKIEARIAKSSSEESKQEPKKLTSAPKPIEPVGKSKGSMTKSIDDPNISFSDYERLRRAQMKRR